LITLDGDAPTGQRQTHADSDRICALPNRSRKETKSNDQRSAKLTQRVAAKVHDRSLLFCMRDASFSFLCGAITSSISLIIAKSLSAVTSVTGQKPTLTAVGVAQRLFSLELLGRERASRCFLVALPINRGGTVAVISELLHWTRSSP
jgi:hypothetical protein